MSRVCRVCKERKEPDQYVRGTNGMYLATCVTCQETKKVVSPDGKPMREETREYMRLIAHDWSTVKNVVELHGVSRHTVRMALKTLVKRGFAEVREQRYRHILEHEYRLTPAGVKQLAVLETVAFVRPAEPPQKDDVRLTGHPWLDLGAKDRPAWGWGCL